MLISSLRAGGKVLSMTLVALGKYLGFSNDSCKIIEVPAPKLQIVVPWIGAVVFLLRWALSETGMASS